MSSNKVAIITSNVNVNGMHCLQHGDDLLVSSEEVGRHLGYENPSEAVNRLFKRNQEELDSYAISVKLTATDGKKYQVRHFTEEGVYIISMLANTEKAASFRAYFAKVLREVRSQQMQLAHESGYAQGVDYAQSQPGIEAFYVRGKLEGIKIASDPTKDRLAKVRKAVRYMKKGLNLAEAAKLVNMSSDTLRNNLYDMGLWKKGETSGKRGRLVELSLPLLEV